jgi:hypothetical protein
VMLFLYEVAVLMWCCAGRLNRLFINKIVG